MSMAQDFVQGQSNAEDVIVPEALIQLGILPIQSLSQPRTGLDGKLQDEQ